MVEEGVEVVGDGLAQKVVVVGVGLDEDPVDVLVEVDGVELDPGRATRVLLDLADLQRGVLEDGAGEAEEEGVAKGLVRRGGGALVANGLGEGVAACDGGGG